MMFIAKESKKSLACTLNFLQNKWQSFSINVPYSTLKFCTFEFVPELTKNISPLCLYIAMISFDALSKNHSIYEQTHLETQHF